ncbi:ketopantoate reductase family protein [Psychrobium sp. nBUS_13]|uniref:ketopantoate reductase family protein n=1 Tax=Psychrobium sp. nBUS_13 TaxID=3395319 RepID=UPI003EBCFE9F
MISPLIQDKHVVKHIAILGHGAIGLLWAHSLVALGHRVTLLSHRLILPPSKQQFVTRDGKELINHLIFSHNFPESVDLVLVTTKAYQVQSALLPHLHKISVPIMLLHNGMGAIDTLAIDSQHQVILATTTHGALKNHNTLTHTGVGNTIIGNYQNTEEGLLEEWQQLLNNALPSVETHSNIRQPLLLKLAINCVINPLTAIHQCKNGELLNSDFQPQIDKLIAELQQVISKLDNDWPHDEISLKKMIMAVARATADNYSSMAQDVKYQRRTEIDFINGYLISKGRQLDINLIENSKLIATLTKNHLSQ